MRKETPLTAILMERNENLLKAGRPPIQPDCVFDGIELLGCKSDCRVVDNSLV